MCIFNGVAPPGFGVERELADDQQSALDVGEVGVHFTFVIVEDAEFGHLGGQPIGIVDGVSVFHAHEDAKALVDGAHHRLVDLD